MCTYYSIATILTLISFIIILSQYEGKKINYYFTVLGLLMTVSCSGYLALALSSSLSEAVLAYKIGYLGGCFIPPVIFSLICMICHYKLPILFRNLLYSYSFFVYALIITIGFKQIYYTDISLSKFDNATILTYEYGWGHTFFYVILYGYILLQIAFLVYALYKNHSVSHKNLYILIALVIINIFLFLGSRLLDIPFEIMPLMYVLDGWILLFLYRRIAMYNVEDCINNSLDNQEFYGYIILDNQKNYLGCNKIAKDIIPAISQCKIDKPITHIPGTDIILNWIDCSSANGQEAFTYQTAQKHYQVYLRPLWHKNKARGYIIEMQEDTDKWNYLNLLSDYNSQLENQVKEKTEHIVNIQSQILVGMADMVENRDNNTGGHIKRTSDVIRILMEVILEHNLLPINQQLYEDIIKAAPMHDLGKIGIDDKILKKPGRLDDEEFAIMQTHAEKSATLVESILKGVEEEHFVTVATNIARHHHEKWNGAGYPAHLSGESIPLEARIMAIADVYDALVSKRCYKEAMSFEKAFEVMIESMGSHFDPNLEKVFLLSRERLEAYYSN